MVADGPLVGQCACEQYAYKCRHVCVYHGIESRHCLILTEFFLKICRNPGHVTGDDEDVAAESDGENQGGRRGEHRLEPFEKSRFVSFERNSFFYLVMQSEYHYCTPDDARNAENDERVFPAESICDESCKPTGQDHAHVVSRLVNRHCRMILTQKGIVRRTEERLASACRHGTQHYQPEETCRQSGKGCRNAPEQDAYSRHPLPAETVARPAADRNHEGIEQVENGSDQSYGRVRKVQCVPDCREHGVEHLPVSLVKQICHPEQQEDFPFVRILFSEVTIHISTRTISGLLWCGANICFIYFFTN